MLKTNLKRHQNWNQTKNANSLIPTWKCQDPDEQDDADDPSVGEVVVAGIRVDHGPPPVDGDHHDGEGRHQNVGPCKKQNK